LVLNPKAYVIIGALFSQFLNSEGDPKRAVLVISALFTVNNLIAFIIWTVAGDWLSRLFSHPDKARLLNRGLSVMLLAVAIWLALGV
ncbi:MAG: LysE family transporter, partial [Pseudomonadota bacterium]